MNRLKKIGVGIALFIVALYGLVWVLSPAVSRHLVESLLEPYSLELTGESNIRVNLFLSQLTISDLRLKKSEKETYNLQHFQLQYSFWPLLTKELKIKEVSLKGMDIVIEHGGGETAVAGISLSNVNGGGAVEAEAEAGAKPVAGPENTGTSNFGVIASEITLEDMVFTIRNQGHQHRLKVAKLQLEQSRYKNRAFASSMVLVGDLDGATFSVDGSLTAQQGTSLIELSVEARELSTDTIVYLLPPTVEQLAVNADITLKTTVEITNGTTRIKDTELQLKAQEFTYADGTYQLSVAKLQLGITGIQSQLDSSGVPGALDASSLVQIDGMQFSLINPSDTLVNLRSFNSGETKIALVDGEYIVQTPQVSLTELALSHVLSSPDLPPLFKTDLIRLTDLKVSQKEMDIAAVTLGASESHLNIAESGQVTTLVSLPASKAAAQQPELVEQSAGEGSQRDGTEGDSAEGVGSKGESSEGVQAAVAKNEQVTPKGPIIRLGEFSLAAPMQIAIDDRSNQHAFNKAFELTSLQVQNLDSSLPEQQTEFTLSAKDEDYFTANVDGWIQPFKPKLNLLAKAKLKEFALYEVAPYLRDTLGFEVKSGQMDADIHAEVKDDNLDSATHLLLRGANFASSQQVNEEANVIGQTAIPLNVALNMLKDSKGNIKLKLPVKGDINDPSFDASHVVGLVIRKVAMSQAKSYLISMFVPYKDVVKVAMVAGSSALKVRIESLPYAPAQLEAGELQSTFVQQLGQLMNDKEKLVVSVCPVATPADIQLPVAAELTPEQHAQAIAVANQRAKSLKAILIEQSGIASSRLHLCSPKVDAGKNAVPRVEFKT